MASKAWKWLGRVSNEPVTWLVFAIAFMVIGQTEAALIMIVASMIKRLQITASALLVIAALRSQDKGGG